ncbi:MAG: DUF4258 domain-containing protein [Deltaproteobacteria bacterium]|nr:DUF4258 domain-containing protein [Deltaproteobacteria bacterium]
MAIIRIIREKVARHEYEFTIPHFFEEMADDNLAFTDIKNAISNGRIQRKFTKDPRGTRYEIIGRTADSRNIAVICRIKNTGKLLFITTYAVEETA